MRKCVTVPYHHFVAQHIFLSEHFIKFRGTVRKKKSKKLLKAKWKKSSGGYFRVCRKSELLSMSVCHEIVRHFKMWAPHLFYIKFLFTKRE